VGMTIEEAIKYVEKGYYSICNDGMWKGFGVDSEKKEEK
jgi:hypothetical protein